MLRDIVIEAETVGDSQTTFRLHVDGNIIAKGVTEEEAHLLASEILERIPVAEAGKTPNES